MNDLSDFSRENRSMSKIQVWADVGGTFTDVIVIDSNGVKHAIKTLSSGLVYASVRQCEDGKVLVDQLPDRLAGQRDRVSGSKAPDANKFWVGARWSTESGGAGRVINQIDCRLELSGDLTNLSAGEQIVLDAGVEAPVLATRMLLGIPPSDPLPDVLVRLGTTKGTNALLTRSGARIALLITEGFGDLPQIGDQTRDDLFAINIAKRTPLTDTVVEVAERLGPDGSCLRPLNESKLQADLHRLKDQGIDSIAICLMHSHVQSRHEEHVEAVAREIGFSNISRSSEVSPLVKLVERSETTSLDAYLNPLLSSYVQVLVGQFGGEGCCDLRLMTSSGNLVQPNLFRGRDSVLSGPAGGVVGLQSIADSTGVRSLIGIDMGGTSTDVSRYEGVVGRRSESMVGGTRIMTPMMDIHTVAAGGGSICQYRDGRLCVGPSSAGSDPGPACYGRGGPLTVTDLNLLMGRLPTEHFPFQLNRNAAWDRIKEIAAEVPGLASEVRRDVAANQVSQGEREVLLSLAEGFLEIAVTHMSEAVRTVTTSQGVDPRGLVLVGFGGAAGLHVCQVAERLGIHNIIEHPFAGMLSAFGMGMARPGCIASRGIYRSLDDLDEKMVGQTTAGLIRDNQMQLLGGSLQSHLVDSNKGAIEHRFEYDLRYKGTDYTLTIHHQSPELAVEELQARFEEQHQAVYGYRQENQTIEVVAIRCESQLGVSSLIEPVEDDGIRSVSAEHDGQFSNEIDSSCDVWHAGNYLLTRRVNRDSMKPGQRVVGPVLIVNPHSSLMVDPGWEATMREDRMIELLCRTSGSNEKVSADSSGDDLDDSVLLEVIYRRLQGIADNMGEVLRRTSISVNVKERRDYSCAVFRGDGSLVANAAHVPVHLGAMGHTVRHILSVFPDMSDDDCYVTNHPYLGGSHLPDVTVVTPVFAADRSDSGRPDESGKPDFLVASRAHHAEIGGISPGSMSPAATCLGQEGVIIRDFALVRQGVDHSDELLALLSDGPFPSRNPQENLADLSAQRAAGNSAARALRELTAQYSTPLIEEMMGKLLDLADQQMREVIAGMSDGKQRFVDQLDDGASLGVTIQRKGERLAIEFDPSPIHPGNFNATPSIVTAATLYVLKCLCGSDIPLCDGVLRSVDLVIPTGMLNPPLNDDPRQCAAVSAGNVETSQRVVDLLLGAWQIAAASQGTMNNLLIGDDSFGYYETIGGGSGASEGCCGASGVHTHMTNTRITDPEILESRLPIRLNRFQLRRGSGGAGLNRGGDGLIREFEFLKDLTICLITSRRLTQPFGIDGGMPGVSGVNTLVRGANLNETEEYGLGPSETVDVAAGDVLVIQTPGGGGWGRAD